MIRIESVIENQVCPLQDLETKLKSQGFVIGSNWEYDYGYFDYLMEDDSSYYFLRIPFLTEIGQLDEIGVQVRVGKPFLHDSKHDEFVGNFTFSLNQFSEDLDSEVPKEYVEEGKDIIKNLENRLFT